MADELLMSTLLSHPGAEDDIAVISEKGDVSFGQLNTYGRQTAAWLLQNGIGQGDKVAVWLVNNVEWLALLFGAARIGATIVSVNTRYRAHEIEYLLEKSGAKMIVMQPGFRQIDFVGLVEQIDPANLPALSKVAVVCDPGDALPEVLGLPSRRFCPKEAAPVAEDTEQDPETPLILFTTSGTTSGPKLVEHNSRSLVLHSRRVALNEGMDKPGARVMASLPICGVFSLNAVLGALAGGAGVILMDTFDAAEFAKRFVRDAATHAYGSDEMYDLIAEAAEGDNPFPAARRLGFASFHPDLDAFIGRMRAKNFPMIGLYGSSEVNALFALQKIDALDNERFQAGGYPVSTADVDVRVRDTETGAVLVSHQSGEIEIRGRTNFLGYLGDATATAKAITEDGFFRTGDIGFMREDGSFVYEGRGGDVLRLGGFLVSPAEIETLMNRLDDVAKVQVVGVEIEGKTKAVAFVIPSEGAVPSPCALRDDMKRNIASFKVPEHIWLIEAFPVTHSSNGTKIQRAQLRQIAMQRLEVEMNADNSS